MIAKAYCCLVIIWAERHITVSWKRKWLVPTPKNAPLNIKAVHLHKLWTGLIVQRINISLLTCVHSASGHRYCQSSAPEQL